MLTTQELQEKWFSEFPRAMNKFAFRQLEKFRLDEDTVSFLTTFGLPKRTAPSFHFASAPNPKKHVVECIGTMEDWFDVGEFPHYVIIGSDNNGHLIILNTDEGCQVQWIDMEDILDPAYMNASIYQLAACLLAYRDFMKHATSKRFTDAHYETLHEIMTDIDPRCMEEGYWHEQLKTLLMNREIERSLKGV